MADIKEVKNSKVLDWLDRVCWNRNEKNETVDGRSS